MTAGKALRIEPGLGQTLYVRLGDAFGWACAVLAAVAVAGALAPSLGKRLPWDSTG